MILLHLALLTQAQVVVPPVAAPEYSAFVAASASNRVMLIRYNGRAAVLERRSEIGPSEPNTSLRAIQMASDLRQYFVTTQGGRGGHLLQVTIADTVDRHYQQQPDTAKDSEVLLASPVAFQLSRDNLYAWITMHDTVSHRGAIDIVYLPRMVEMASIPACANPAAAMFSADGSRYYYLCRGEDELRSVDVAALEPRPAVTLAQDAAHHCDPVAVVERSSDSTAFVACATSREVLEVDLHEGSVVRRIPVELDASSLALTHDGQRLVVAGAQAQAVTTISLRTASRATPIVTQLAQSTVEDLLRLSPELWFMTLPLARSSGSRAPVAIAVSDDDRFAFVAVSRGGTAPGSVSVIDLATNRQVATVEVPGHPSSLVYWKTEGVRR